MTKICHVVAMSQNNVIGINNDLPWHIPADLKRFKALTSGRPVIMGRKTFESILARIQKPLPNRHSIVISGQGYNYQHDDVICVSTIEQAIEAAKTLGADEVMVIGGASIYEQTLPYTDKIYLTVIKKDYNGDAYYPNLNQREWDEAEIEHCLSDITPNYSFKTLIRK